MGRAEDRLEITCIKVIKVNICMTLGPPNSKLSTV